MPELSYSARMEALVRKAFVRRCGCEGKEAAAEAGELMTEAAAEANAVVTQLLLELGSRVVPLIKVERAVDVAAFLRGNPPTQEHDALTWAEDQAAKLLGPTLAGGS